MPGSAMNARIFGELCGAVHWRSGAHAPLPSPWDKSTRGLSQLQITGYSAAPDPCVRACAPRHPMQGCMKATLSTGDVILPRRRVGRHASGMPVACRMSDPAVAR